MGILNRRRYIIIWEIVITGRMKWAEQYYIMKKLERLTPGDPDIQFNLQLANQKIVDKVPSEGTIFIYSDWKKFENRFTEKQWAIILHKPSYVLAFYFLHSICYSVPIY